MLLNRTTEELARGLMPKFQLQWSEEETAGLLCFRSQSGHLQQERDAALSALPGEKRPGGG